MRPLHLLLPLAVVASRNAEATEPEFGTVEVRQLSGGNESSEVSFNLARGASPASRSTGGNRGDYNISFGNSSDTNTGILITSPAQVIRDDSAVGGPSVTTHFATTGVVPSGSRYIIPVFRSPEGDEANINASFVFLPYDSWLGGIATNAENGTDLTTFKGSPGLTLGTHFIDSAATIGEYTVKLSPIVANASKTGILLASGGKNEDNYALSRANSDGSFTVFCHDNGQNGAEYENDPVSFAYLPTSAAGTGRVVALGRVNGDGSTDVAGGSFQITKAGTGRWQLTIPGQSGATGVLVVTPAGGASNNADNIVSHEWNADHGYWIVESRDLPSADLQNMSDAAEDAFSFAFFSTAQNHGSAPSVTLTGPENGSSFRQGETITLTANATDDGSITSVRFYDDDKALPAVTTSPYRFSWKNAPLGRHQIEAAATDNLGFVTRSSPVTVSILPAAGHGGIFLDGVNGEALCPSNAPHDLQEFTLECWFRKEPDGTPVKIGGYNAIPLVSRGGAGTASTTFFLGIDTDTGRLIASLDADGTDEEHTIIGKTEVTTGAWQHAAATFDGTLWRLYLNGNLESTLDTGGVEPAVTGTRRTALGTVSGKGGRLLGTLDEVRIWNRVRTHDEIRTALNTPVTQASGLISRYGMEETSGSSLIDSGTAAATATLGGGAYRTLGASFDLNVPPGASPALPAQNQTSVPRNAVLTTQASDPDDSQVTVKFYGRSTDSGTLSDFTVVALPDTQFYSENVGGNLAAIFSQQTDWIVAQRKTMNIAAVLHLGDISQNGDNPATSAAQWTNASNAMYRLENPLTTQLTQGIPYSMAVGNHDQTPIGNADGTTTGFNTYFGVHPNTGLNHFRNKDYYGGTSVPDSADNNYMFFSAGGVDFIVISLEYDLTPDPADLEWADELLKANPTRCGIVTTHWTVNTGNPASFSDLGAAIYEKLKGNPNLILLHGGHIAGEGRRSDTFQGRTVHSILADYQGRVNGGDGWLRVMKFRPSLNRIEVRTYSPKLDRYETDADSQFNLNADLSGRGKPFVELGTVTAAPGSVSLPWSTLEKGTRYEWYAEVSDGTNVTRSEISTFTTTGATLPPTSSFTAPANGAAYTVGTAISLEVAASDPDGTVASVRYYSGTTLLGQTTVAPHVFSWTNAPVGTHTLIARATDNEGAETASAPIEIRVNPLPIVNMTATDPIAGEFGPDQSLGFTVSRNETPSSPLQVNYTLSGTATPGADYVTLPGSITIPAGERNALITAQVIPDELHEGTETVILQLAANSAYQVWQATGVQGTIQDKPFSEWLHAKSLSSGSGDADANGTPDILDYYTGSNNGGLPSPPVLRATVAADGVFRAVFPHAKSAVDVIGEIEWSTNLTSWHRSGESDGTRTVTITTAPISGASDDPETLEATATVNGGSPVMFFLRLSVRP